jgi:hypothetical protein
VFSGTTSAVGIYLRDRGLGTGGRRGDLEDCLELSRAGRAEHGAIIHAARQRETRAEDHRIACDLVVAEHGRFAHADVNGEDRGGVAGGFPAVEAEGSVLEADGRGLRRKDKEKSRR